MHRLYDCALTLLPGHTPPRDRVYPLFLPNTREILAYIKENLKRGFFLESFLPDCELGLVSDYASALSFRCLLVTFCSTLGSDFYLSS